MQQAKQSMICCQSALMHPHVSLRVMASGMGLWVVEQVRGLPLTLASLWTFSRTIFPHPHGKRVGRRRMPTTAVADGYWRRAKRRCTRLCGSSRRGGSKMPVFRATMTRRSS